MVELLVVGYLLQNLKGVVVVVVVL